MLIALNVSTEPRKGCWPVRPVFPPLPLRRCQHAVCPADHARQERGGYEEDHHELQCEERCLNDFEIIKSL